MAEALVAAPPSVPLQLWLRRFRLRPPLAHSAQRKLGLGGSRGFFAVREGDGASSALLSQSSARARAHFSIRSRSGPACIPHLTLFTTPPSCPRCRTPPALPTCATAASPSKVSPPCPARSSCHHPARAPTTHHPSAHPPSGRPASGALAHSGAAQRSRPSARRSPAATRPSARASPSPTPASPMPSG